MAKRKVRIEAAPDVQEQPAMETAGVNPLEMVTVRYIGPGQAVLAGQLMLHGETRATSRAQVERALKFHPDGFEIVGETPSETTPDEGTHVDRVEPIA
jgi:hypothetical protein